MEVPLTTDQMLCEFESHRGYMDKVTRIDPNSKLAKILLQIKEDGDYIRKMIREGKVDQIKIERPDIAKRFVKPF